MKNAYDLIASFYDYDMAMNMPYPDVEFYLDRAAGAKSVLEVGCGTGRIGIPVAERCARLVGIDLSWPMLWHFKQKLDSRKPPLTNVFLAVMDARSLSLKQKFDYIFFAFSGIDYLNRPKAVGKFLLSLKHLLEPGGRLLLDAFVPKQPAVPDGTWKLDYIRELPGGKRLKRSRMILKQGPVNQIYRRYEESRAGGGPVRTIETRSLIRPYSPDELRELLKVCGFRVYQEWWDYGLKPDGPADFFSVEAEPAG